MVGEDYHAFFFSVIFSATLRCNTNLSRFSGLGVIVAGILLTGCMNMQTNLSLYGDEQWSGVQAVQLSPEFEEMMEQGDTSTTETIEGGGTVTTETSFDAEGFDEWLENAQNLSDSDDFEVTFNEITGDDGSQGFILQATGQRYEAMNQIFFNGEADITAETVNGQRQVTIRYDFSEASESSEPEQELSPEEMAMQQEMLAAFGLSISFRISGGEIVSSNASRVEDGTAIWETPSLIEVTLTEAAELSPDTLALQEPPEDSGFSVQAFESMMDGFIEELESSVDSAVSSSGDEATPGTEAKTETAPATTDSDTIAGEADTATETTTTESSTQATESTTGAEAEAEMTTTGTEMADEDAAAAPAEEEQALPASGAVLPGQTSPALPILAGLVLATLVGAGAAGSLLKQK